MNVLVAELHQKISRAGKKKEKGSSKHPRGKKIEMNENMQAT